MKKTQKQALKQSRIRTAFGFVINFSLKTALVFSFQKNKKFVLVES